jgi:hypothetical protein
MLVLPPGSTLAVTGSAGIVGQYAIQFGALLGLEVTGDANPRTSRWSSRRGPARGSPWRRDGRCHPRPVPVRRGRGPRRRAAHPRDPPRRTRQGEASHRPSLLGRDRARRRGPPRLRRRSPARGPPDRRQGRADLPGRRRTPRGGRRRRAPAARGRRRPRPPRAGLQTGRLRRARSAARSGATSPVPSHRATVRPAIQRNQPPRGVVGRGLPFLPRPSATDPSRSP